MDNPVVPLVLWLLALLGGVGGGIDSAVLDGKWKQKMMETTAVGMGIMMTGVAVAVGALLLEGAFLVLGRALCVPTLAVSCDPVAIDIRTQGELKIV